MIPTLPHDVWQQERPDGTVLLGSNHPLGPVVRRTGDWMDRWAAEAPDRTFVAERSGAGWRELSYGALRQQVRAVAAALVGRGLGPERPVAILSGPGVDHAVLTLAAQYAGVPVVPLAEQYSLVEAAHPRLAQAIGMTRPGMVFADDAARYGAALALPCMAGVLRVCVDVTGAGGPVTPFAELLQGDAGAAIDAVHEGIGPDNVAKILFTSGSTGTPKGVVTTHRMLCVNAAQIVAGMPLLLTRPHRMLDWLPWNHVFSGNHNFNITLSTGGSLYIDDGRPTAAGFAATLRNVKDKPSTVSFNVPVAYTMLAAAMRDDAALRRAFFGELDLIFYAAAGVTASVWAELERMARQETGRVPPMLAGWGMSETAPSATQTHHTVKRPGNIGVPLPGVVVKLLPDGAGRVELRVKGDNVMEAYFEEPAKTREAFDEEGFLITGDAVRLAEPDNLAAGLIFDGRVAEEFKLSTGTWVRATTLRLALLPHVAAVAADIVLAGHDRDELGLLVFPDRAKLAALGIQPVEHGGALHAPELAALLAAALQEAAGPQAGSSTRIARALVLAEPPSMTDGELTPKGSLNARRVITGREAMVQRLYDDADPAVVFVSPGRRPAA